MTQSLSPAQANALQRANLLTNGDRTWFTSAPIAIPAGGGQVQVPAQAIKPIGATTRFVIEGYVNVSNTGAAAVALVNAANVLSQVQLIDPNNNTRIQTSGRILTHISTIKRCVPYGASYTTDTPFGYTAAGASNSAPASIASGAAGVVKFAIEVPCARNVTPYAMARGAADLSGVMLTQLINAFAQLTLSFNAAPIAAAGADAVNAIYQGSTGAGSITGGSFKVFQEVYTLPAGGGAGFPMLDAATIYKIEDLPSPQAPVAGADCIQLIPNFRKVFNAIMTTDQGTQAPAITDVNYFRVFPNANYKLRDYDPQLLDFYTRDNLEVGMPVGQYWFDFRDKPLYTPQTGQANLVVNMASVGPAANIVMSYESLLGTADVSLAGSV